MKKYYLFFIVIGLFSAGMIMLNAEARKGPVHDNTVAADLATIQNDIDNYYSKQSSLPSSLKSLALSDSKVEARKGEYEYIRQSVTAYQLCGTYLTSNKGASAAYPASYDDISYPDATNHAKGRVCYQKSVEPIPVPMAE